jgi:hypothetical protein
MEAENRELEIGNFMAGRAIVSRRVRGFRFQWGQINLESVRKKQTLKQGTENCGREGKCFNRNQRAKYQQEHALTCPYLVYR